MTTRLNPRNGLPPAQGLYDPAHEHDACGIGFVASIGGHKSHDIIRKGIQVLLNLAHRGACGCDPETGDGAGVLIQIPHKFFARECEKLGFSLPKPGTYGVGMTFLPVEKHQRLQCEGILERIVREEGLTLLGWRDTPVYASAIGRVARASQPYIQQIFVRCAPGMDEDAFERKLYVVRKRAENEIRESGIEDAEMFYIPSLSCRTIVYKGLLLAPQIANFYRELSDPDAVSALCLVHQRFSTNTFPSWQRAHPYRYIAHNGEINTLRGNVNWMHARQSLLQSPLFGDDMKKLHPDHRARRQRFGELRQRGRVAAAGGTQPAARHGHADSRSVVGQSAHEAGEARLLRISRLPDGAVGRPGGHRFHRRPRHRRDARPQRPAARTIRRDPRRSGRDGVGSRSARHCPPSR